MDKQASIEKRRARSRRSYHKRRAKIVASPEALEKARAKQREANKRFYAKHKEKILAERKNNKAAYQRREAERLIRERTS